MSDPVFLKPSTQLLPLLNGSENWSELLIKSNQKAILQWENEQFVPANPTHLLSWGYRIRSGNHLLQVAGGFLDNSFASDFPDLLSSQPEFIAETEEGVFRAGSMIRELGGHRIFQLEEEQFTTILEFPDGTIRQKQHTWFRAQALVNLKKGLSVWQRWGASTPPGISDWIRLAGKIMHDPYRRLPLTTIEPGLWPVILAPGWTGLLFHEAIGHALEADTIQSGQSWLTANDAGNQLAPDFFSVSDLGNNPTGRGFEEFDDEGSAICDTELIKNGRWVGTLTNRSSKESFPIQPLTGNARCYHAFDEPLVRMRNLCVLPGPHQPSELLQSVRKGIFIRDLGGGLVDGTTGKFSFPVEDACLIKNGKITHRLSPFSVEGYGEEILKAVEGVGSDFYLDSSAGWCEKLGQSVPVSIGQPTVLVSSMKVIR